MARGGDPRNITKYQLIARSGGRCQICNEFLLVDSFTMSTNDDSNMAHIVASSPDGPRGDSERSHLLSKDINNLMLLCRKHHNMIDSHPDVYTEEVLSKIKEAQEKRVAMLGETMNVESTAVVILESPIKRSTVKVNIEQVLQAVVLEKTPYSSTGIPMLYTPIADYRSREYWRNAIDFLEMSFGQVKALHTWHPKVTFSVFPLAPIPIIIQLGYLFGDKIKVEVYQKFRDPDTWSWLTKENTNSFSIEKTEYHDGQSVAVIMSISSAISHERIRSVIDASIIYEISASSKGVNAIQSKSDLSAFWHTYLKVLDEIRNAYPTVTDIALFPAIPVSAAFEIGSRYMRGVYPKVHVFDDDQGFFETLTIGDVKND